MRLFEGILIFDLVLAALLMMSKSARKWLTGLILAGLCIAVLHVVHEGAHWQMFPALFGLLLLIFWRLMPMRIRSSAPPRTEPLLASCILLFLAMSIGLSILFPMFTLPKPTGTYPVGTRIIYLHDDSRNEEINGRPDSKRELMVQIWYPAQASKGSLAAYQRFAETTVATSYRSVLWTNSRMDAPVASEGGPFCVLLYNHGWGGRRTEATFLTEELASHGYIVAAIDHTYNAGRVALPGGHIVNGAQYAPLDVNLRTAEQIKTTWDDEVRIWVDDEIFVLNELAKANRDANSPWYGHLDTDHAGAFGHSFGGSASIHALDADKRIQAAINMDGWTFDDALQRTSRQPAMFLYQEGSRPHPENLTSSAPKDREEAELDVSDMEQIEASLREFGGYRLYVSHATHSDFTDHPMVSPWRRWIERGHISPRRIQTITRDYVLAFFDETLHEKKPPLLHSGNESPFSEVRFEAFVPVPKANAAQP
jgi:dienelactone hydrolase